MGETKEKQDNKKEYKEFRALLKKGIGLRTQADFAEACGITRQYLNRLLREELISRPSVDTVRAMAKNLTGVTYNELMESCGYPTLNIQELADAIAVDIEEFFMNRDNTTSPVTHATIAELCDTFIMLYSPAEINGMKFKIESEKDNENKNYQDADKMVSVRFTWDTSDYDCTTNFELYYAKLRSGAIVMVGAEVKRGKYYSTAIIKEKAKDTAESRLLDAIFGHSSGVYYPTFETGYGFPYKKTPKKFKEFLSNHRAAFCTDSERSELWRRVVEGNEDPDDVFKDFLVEDGEGFGTGAVIGAIMTEELKDLECMKTLRRFCYIDGDKSMPESEQDSVVFTIHDGDGKCRDEILPYLYFYARELGIANFGRCYHRFMMEIDLHDFYKTEDYGKKIR